MSTGYSKRSLRRGANAVPEVGLDAFQSLQTLGTPENVANPARSDPSTAQSKAQGVHIVHTPKFLLYKPC
jgi:hypothetical protein